MYLCHQDSGFDAYSCAIYSRMSRILLVVQENFVKIVLNSKPQQTTIQKGNSNKISYVPINMQAKSSLDTCLDQIKLRKSTTLAI